MLDIKLIRDQYDLVRENIKKRGNQDYLNLLEVIKENDIEWRELSQKLNDKRAERNTISRQVAELRKNGEDATHQIEQTDILKNEIQTLENREDMQRKVIDRNIMSVPNILHESVPVGADGTANVEIRKEGVIPTFDFELLSHGEIAEKLELADFDRAARIAGTGFNYLFGDLAYLDLALMKYAVDFMRSKGYTLVETPFMMRRKPYEGVTDLGDFENVMYKIENEDLYLIATSEHPMAAMYKDEIIDEDRLPLKYVGISPCFRKEIGAHGVDTKGLFRMHQFNKVEQFIFCKPEDSWALHEELLANVEEMHQGLELPYRIVNVCTGDIGTLAAKKYDLELWFPRQNKYGETASCSNCTDYQARRLNIRCGKQGGDKRIAHTLNNTAIATSRTMVAILENYQNEDGTVTIPKILQEYMGGKEKLGN
jgi:seryl-tRNA synthetase